MNKNIGLSHLISPKSLPEFLKDFKNNSPFVIHHNLNELSELTSLPSLASLDALLKSWPYVIEAHLPDVRDEASAIETSPKDARKLFDNGMGLLFKEANILSPVLDELLENLQSDLGLSALTFKRCLVYATPEGKGTAPHFDQNINFVLQLQGTKKWWIAPNTLVENPLTRHTIGLEMDPELASYVESMPDAMPNDAKLFVLKPGSILFVPRGSWHSTEAQGEALSLNFTFSAPAWLDLFLAALRSRLVQSPEWRETAQGLSGNFLRKDADEKMNFLLCQVISDLPYWSAEDILNATDPMGP
jgi:50S ribosomal protein L16 3-hydroxylase